MKDRLGRIIYVGKAQEPEETRLVVFSTRSRAHRSMQPKIRALIDLITDFDTIEVKSEPEALLLEGKLIKQWRPRYNTDFTDDKRFLLVRVDLGEELPRFRLTRLKKEDRSRYFGPFAHSGLLRKTLAQMRRQFGILLGDGTPQKLPDGTLAALRRRARGTLRHGERRHAPKSYRRRVEDACAFLEGKSREWLETLRAEMIDARPSSRNSKRRPSCATSCSRSSKRSRKTRRFERHDPTRPARRRRGAARAAAKRSQLPSPPRTMECFDISHISGTFVVASMVHFADGRPDKDNYRRFQIKSFIGNDDFRAMEEVVGRRYRRLAEENKPFPDLVVIDGGRGQIGAALKAFVALDLTPPPLIGLAKKHETIIFPDERAAAESAAESSRAESAAAPARRGAPLRQHLQRESPLEENPRERARRFRRARPGAPRRAARRISAASIGCAPPAWRRSPRSQASARAWRRSLHSFLHAEAPPSPAPEA